jgi:hypothetical protein
MEQQQELMVPSAPTVVGGGGGVSSEMKGLKYQIKKMGKRYDWKMILLGICVLVCVVLSSLLYYQWKYAIIGRIVTQNVVAFLEVNGAKKDHGMLQGGCLKEPLPIGNAVVATVAQMINEVQSIIEKEKVDEVKKANVQEVMGGTKEQQQKKAAMQKPKKVANKPHPVAAGAEVGDAVGVGRGKRPEFPEKPVECRVKKPSEENESVEKQQDFIYTPMVHKKEEPVAVAVADEEVEGEGQQLH